VVSRNARAIKSRKDSPAKSLSAFDHPNLATYYLFKNAPGISENGIENIQQKTSSASETIKDSHVVLLQKQRKRYLPNCSEKTFETALSVKLELQAVSSDWTAERIKRYWRNNWRNKV
jgi:hypothetical protein